MTASSKMDLRMFISEQPRRDDSLMMKARREGSRLQGVGMSATVKKEAFYGGKRWQQD